MKTFLLMILLSFSVQAQNPKTKPDPRPEDFVEKQKYVTPGTYKNAEEKVGVYLDTVCSEFPKLAKDEKSNEESSTSCIERAAELIKTFGAVPCNDFEVGLYIMSVSLSLCTQNAGFDRYKCLAMSDKFFAENYPVKIYEKSEMNNEWIFFESSAIKTSLRISAHIQAISQKLTRYVLTVKTSFQDKRFYPGMLGYDYCRR